MRTDLSSELPDLSGDVVLDSHLEPAPPMPLAEPPPERVRFATAMVAVLDSGDEFAGAVLNLSLTGLSCALPCALSEGEELVVHFRLALAEPEVACRAIVVWRRRADATQDLYGLRLLEMDAALSARIGAAVRERVEGRAGAWPLPVVPTAAPIEETRHPHPLLTGALGMVAGAVVAVVATLVPRVGTSQTLTPAHALASVAPAVLAATSQAGSDAGPDVGPSAVARQGEGTTEVAPPEAPPRAEEPDAEPVAATTASPEARAPEGAEAAPEPQHEVPVAAPLFEVEAPPAPAVASSDVGSLPVLPSSGDDSLLALTLTTDGPVDTYKSFWLDSPRRLVIDVDGRKSALGSPDFAIAHALASRLRVGSHGDKVRFVIEAAEATSPHAQLRRDGDALIVELRRR